MNKTHGSQFMQYQTSPQKAPLLTMCQTTLAFIVTTLTMTQTYKKLTYSRTHGNWLHHSEIIWTYITTQDPTSNCEDNLSHHPSTPTESSWSSAHHFILAKITTMITTMIMMTTVMSPGNIHPHKRVTCTHVHLVSNKNSILMRILMKILKLILKMIMNPFIWKIFI